MEIGNNTSQNLSRTESKNIDFSQSILVFHVSQNTFRLCIANKHKKIVYFSEYNALEPNATDTDIKHPYFYQKYQRKYCIIDTQMPFTIIPEILYQKSNEKDMLSMVTGGKMNSETIAKKIYWNNSYLIENKLEDDFIKQDPSYNLFSENEVLLNSIPFFQKQIPTAVVCHQKHKHIILIAYNNERLLMYNTFEVEHPEDIAYFILLTYKEYTLDMLKIPLLYIGLYEPNEILQNYIQHIKPVSLEMESTPYLQKDKLAEYFITLAPILCEL